MQHRYTLKWRTRVVHGLPELQSVVAYPSGGNAPGPFVLLATGTPGAAGQEFQEMGLVVDGFDTDRERILRSIQEQLPGDLRAAVIRAMRPVRPDAIPLPVAPPPRERSPTARLTKTISAMRVDEMSDERFSVEHTAPVHVHRGTPVVDVPEVHLRLRETPHHLPTLRRMLHAVVGRPVQLVLSGDVETSATDCRAVVEFNPTPLEQGCVELAYGRILHEAGHLRYSFGTSLLGRAHQLGGKDLGWIANVGLDRKDDQCLAAEFPGYARLLWARLADTAGAYHRADGVWRRPDDPVDDFFLACKIRRPPRTLEGRRCHRIMRRAIARIRSGERDECLLEASLAVQELLRPAFAARAGEVRAGLGAKTVRCSGCEGESPHFSASTHRAFQKMLQQFLRQDREREHQKLAEHLKRLQRGSGGIPYRGESLAVERVGMVAPETYAAARAEIASYLPGLRRELQQLGRQEERQVLRGLAFGHLDDHRIARIAIGAPGVYRTRVEEFVTDCDIHVLLDESGSMEGDPAMIRRRIGTLFNECAYTTPGMTGHLWGFSDRVVDYGPCRPRSGVAGATGTHGGTNEAGALAAVGTALLRSPAAHRMLLVVGDGGSNDAVAVRRMVDALTRSGICCMRGLIGVFAAPAVYPLEFLFAGLEEFLGEFGVLLGRIVRASHART
ncbi:VWA domain-containing protein [Candidatus Uhrbacteria bacterium]|nr:VWA domain-containing protein [Candidatus Uhrbacteria bacterium]